MRYKSKYYALICVFTYSTETPNCSAAFKSPSPFSVAYTFPELYNRNALQQMISKSYVNDLLLLLLVHIQNKIILKKL